MRSISQLLYTIPLAAMLACGSHDSALSGDSTSAPNADLGSSAADESIIASADVGYGTVFFHEYHGEDGSTAIAISQLAPNTYASTPLHDAMTKHTNLEVFLALVPGQEPPQSYLDAHPHQATEFGRETTELLELAFDADAPIEKTSQQCKNWITPAKSSDGCYYINYTGVKENNNKTGLQSLTLAATTSYSTTGICNDGSYNVQGRLRWAPAGTESYTSPGWSTVPPGGGWIWFGAYIHEPCTGAAPGEFCFPTTKKVKWRVEGKSTTTYGTNTFDLRGAIIDGYIDVTPVPRQCIIR